MGFLARHILGWAKKRVLGCVNLPPPLWPKGVRRYDSRILGPTRAPIPVLPLGQKSSMQWRIWLHGWTRTDTVAVIRPHLDWRSRITDSRAEIRRGERAWEPPHQCPRSQEAAFLPSSRRRRRNERERRVQDTKQKHQLAPRLPSVFRLLVTTERASRSVGRSTVVGNGMKSEEEEKWVHQ